MTKKAFLKVLPKEPTSDKLRTLAEEYEFAFSQLKSWRELNLDAIVMYETLQGHVELARTELETEAKQQARHKDVSLSSDHFEIRVQRRKVRTVHTNLLHNKSTACYPGSTQRIPIADACPGLAKINLKKLDEYVESGLIPAGIAKSYTEDGEDQLAFYLDEKSVE